MVTVSDNKRCKACNREELEQHDKTKPIKVHLVVAMQLSMTAAMAILENMSSTMTEQFGARQFYTPHDVPAVLSWGAGCTWLSDTHMASRDAGISFTSNSTSSGPYLVGSLKYHVIIMSSSSCPFFRNKDRQVDKETSSTVVVGVSRGDTVRRLKGLGG